MVMRNKASVYNRRPSFKKIRASLRQEQVSGFYDLMTPSL
jgi:hypothetical protein